MSQSIRQEMIAVLPDTSFNTLQAQPLSDIILPPPATEISHDIPQPEPQMEAVHSKIINKRRIFSWTNILIGLAILSLLSVAAYFYWPQEKLRSNITDTTNSLLDISNLPQKQTAGQAITHDPNGSGTGSTGSTGKTGSSHNDKPQKTSKPIIRSEKPFNTVIGNGPPGDDGSDEEDEDPNRKKKQEGGPGIYSDAEDESQQQESSLDDDGQEEQEDGFWMAPPKIPGFPNVGATNP